jgi:asparagine synthase (glutamine-hydrolysing)
MTGICGWLGNVEGDPAASLAAMRARLTWNGAPGAVQLIGDGFALAAVGAPDTIGVLENEALAIVFHGHGLWRAEAGRAVAVSDLCRRLATAYRERGEKALEALGGDFSLAIVDRAERRALLAIDRMGVRNLVYRHTPGATAFADSLDALAALPGASPIVDPQSIYDYVYFHMIPGPDTVYRGWRRLPAGHCLVVTPGEADCRSYWHMHFDETDRADDSARAGEFRAALRTGVAAFAAPAHTGTFLSGGTDSSTVTGLLAEIAGAPVPSFSIGFDASGYDEMEYAHIAARRFATEHREYYVTPDDVLQALPMVAAEYDQPFGNSSAVPAYYCARLAHDHGIVRMLAGDGGDELFGGNSRYARQYQFALYDKVPAVFRNFLLEPVLRTALASHVPLLRKARSYVEQASLAMPARYETYNLLERFGPANVFDADFLAGVDTSRPLAMMAEVYEAADAQTLINRMLALDLKFTLADNDLPKVMRMCDRAGVDVAFPLLHDSIVDFSARLAPSSKLRGAKLRYFFKESLRGFLPDEIIAKTKHGFGLPAGPWLATYEPLRALSRDALDSLQRRRMFRREFLEGLLDTRLHAHAGYYGTMVWVLMVLELWLQAHVDVRR